MRDKGVVHRLFAEIAPDMAAREGGYTRITKIGARKGDNAPMVVIELVREPLSAKKATVKEAEGATRRAAKQEEAKAAAAETKAAEDADTADTTDEAASAELPEGAAAANEDGSAPEGYTVKGNADSNLYHEPDGQWYDQTVAEVWFKTAEDAEKAGFKKAGSGS